ncbi:AraC family transcriptional regulator [Paenibacillus sp. FSL R7-0048]|uniref:AraC family transcriptional regulator n=1 Tax=Paenibacillus TaxID=44249 RepID=UPI0009700AB6|nr:AraC family transcriptional regulator [Paenibacillus odorifer]OMD70120.1 AraC family transcriptional regulator [Paenibacillus odorifer]OMD83583.1 AraC family transcriptional regulator [Paenibacillus odorifer]
MNKFIYKRSAGITALSAQISDFEYKNHSHQEYAIGVTLRGIQHYHLNGNLQLSHPKGVMLFNPEQTHDGRAYDKIGLDYIMLYIEPQMILDLIEKKDVVRLLEPVVYSSKLRQKVLSLFRAISNERDEALCYDLFITLIESLMQTDLSSDYKRDDTVIRRAKNIIHQTNLESMLRIDDICSELDLSKFQFIRFFKAHTGITPYQYFLNLKVDYAKRIIETYGDIYLAVAMCGFVDLTHLNKLFKNVYGTTAFDYMSHIKN